MAGTGAVDIYRLLLQRGLQCITAWFGSVGNFEALVRTDVLQSLQDQLSREVFTYKQIAVSAMPILWHYMGSVATIHFLYLEGRDGSNIRAKGRPLWGTLREFVRGLAWAFGVVPVTVLIAVRLSYLMQRRHAWAVCDTGQPLHHINLPLRVGSCGF